MAKMLAHFEKQHENAVGIKIFEMFVCLSKKIKCSTLKEIGFNR
jgi:hypothetical protein